MNFRTELKPYNSNWKIDYNDKILSLGSCFSENIGNKLSHLQFETNINPFGIMFHPFSIENVIKEIHNKKVYTRKELNKRNEIYFSWNHHSIFSKQNPKQVLSDINKGIKAANVFLKETKTCIITLGTAWVYILKETGETVANCHEMANKLFEKRLLNISEIQTSLSNCCSLLLENNPDIKIIFCTSPVRHIKEGFSENTRSKSRLIESIHHVCANNKNTSYFPSYEILLDDLRDYRFYKSDMVHPNETAIDYIFDNFLSSYFQENTIGLIKEVEKINKLLNHRPFFPNSELHQKFRESTLKKILSLKKNLPKDAFENEIEELKSTIKC